MLSAGGINTTARDRQLLSYGHFQESKKISTDNLNHISFAISPGQEFCRKSYGVVVSLYAIVLPIGPGLREVCHLVTEVKTKPNVVNPYQIADMIDMVGHVFLVQFLFVGVPNKDTERVHSHDPIARRQFADQIVREISHGGDESSTVRVRGHHGPVIEMEQVFHSLIIEVAYVEIHPETGGFLHHLDAKVRQPAFPPLLHRIKETSVRCIVSAAPRHPDAPHSQLVEDTQQTEIVPDGLQALERKKNGKLPFLPGVPYFPSVAAQGEETGALLHLRMESAYLIQSSTKPHLGQVLVGNKQRGDHKTDAPLLHRRKIIPFNDPGLSFQAFSQHQIQKIEMGIDDQMVLVKFPSFFVIRKRYAALFVHKQRLHE